MHAKNPTEKFIVGAYVASRSLRQWEPADETDFFKRLREREKIRGLEHGFYGKLHRFDDAWFLDNVHPDWEYSFTTLPGLCHLFAEHPAAGLASQDKGGQARALEFLFAANQAVKKLNAHHGRKAVLAVQVHSAPAGFATREAFAEGLKTVCSWDWDGAKILVEHCDRFKADGSHAKGFLSLEDEIWAIETAQKASPVTPVAAMLNWARSVIEERDVGTVLKHIDALKSRGLIKGFLFSGTSAQHDSPYLYYGDKHAPAPTIHNGQILVSDSLMTADEMNKSLTRLSQSELDFLGFKIMPLPMPTESRQNLIYIDFMLDFLARAAPQAANY